LRIVAVAQLEKGKGVDVLLRALPGFSRPYELTVVGDGREAQSLADLAERLHIGRSVRFVGAVPHAQVANYLRVHDVFVFPTRLPESLGLVAVEAMACGVPVIGSRVGALPEYIRDGVNGFLFECGNETELAQRLEHFAALDPEQRRAMSRNARKCAEQYDGENCTSELLRVFHEVTGQAA
jgi:glycosyltransferase involved in cell wall biosynthesis